MRAGKRTIQSLFLLSVCVCLSNCHHDVSPNVPLPSAFQSLIPKPATATSAGKTFTLTSPVTIAVDDGNAEQLAIANYLAQRLQASTGYTITVATGTVAGSSILMSTAGADASLGQEGYDLIISEDVITLDAFMPEGLFRGIQTIRQLLPPQVESATKQSTAWTIETGHIRDLPLYSWRGVMLDVSRHFFSVDDVKKCIDQIAYYKLNRLHLHLSDDQGWRIEINSWPQLTAIGSTTEVGGGAGGFYTQAQYSDLVNYAQQRYITIVPEIDMPGHVTAAQASYASLNCDGNAIAPYTGTAAGFSSLCLEHDTLTYQFTSDVIGELAAITPGPYLHIGGDEVPGSQVLYERFVRFAAAKANANGKTLVGWEQIGAATIGSNAIVQHWNSQAALQGVAQGAKVLMSPDAYTYFDQKYDPKTPIGQTWAGYIDIEQSYSWDPASELSGVGIGSIVGIEAPLWTETVQTISDIELMLFPRIASIAEIGWSPSTNRSWSEYRTRLATHGPRLQVMGINYYKSSQIEWP